MPASPPGTPPEVEAAPGVKARVPADCSVFVSPCPPHWDEAALAEKFQAFGNIVSCSIVADKMTGQRKAQILKSTVYIEFYIVNVVGR